jgi:hypothetical protein
MAQENENANRMGMTPPNPSPEQVQAAREFIGQSGLGDVTKGCADMCYCERCVNAIATLLATREAEVRRAALEEAAHLAEVTIQLSMGPATAEQVCEHLAKQRELIVKRIAALEHK